MTGIIEGIHHGLRWTVILVKTCVDLLCEGIASAASFIAKQLAKLIPGLGYIVGVVASIAVNTAFTLYFTDQRVNRISNSVSSYIRKKGIKSVKSFLTVSLGRMFRR